METPVQVAVWKHIIFVQLVVLRDFVSSVYYTIGKIGALRRAGVACEL